MYPVLTENQSTGTVPLPKNPNGNSGFVQVFKGDADGNNKATTTPEISGKGASQRSPARFFRQGCFTEISDKGASQRFPTRFPIRVFHTELRIGVMSMQLVAAEKWNELIKQASPLHLYVAVAIISATTLFFFLFHFLRKTKSNTIVLAGLTGSGKTVIFYQLRDGSSHQGTVTSMDPNEGIFIMHSETEKKGKAKPVHMVDVPGHARLRPKLDEFLPSAAGVVFVLDALDLPNIHSVAEYLYDILTKASIVKRKTPVLIVCNKTDKVTAHSKEFIKKQLEKELEKLRASRNAISDADIANEFTLGVQGQPFTFSHCHNKVMVTDASGLTGEVSQIEQFIRELVKA